MSAEAGDPAEGECDAGQSQERGNLTLGPGAPRSPKSLGQPWAGWAGVKKPVSSWVTR